MLVFQNHQIVWVSGTRYKELTVEKIYSVASDVAEVLKYLSPEIDGDKLPRKFFLT